MTGDEAARRCCLLELERNVDSLLRASDKIEAVLRRETSIAVTRELAVVALLVATAKQEQRDEADAIAVLLPCRVLELLDAHVAAVHGEALVVLRPLQREVMRCQEFLLEER